MPCSQASHVVEARGLGDQPGGGAQGAVGEDAAVGGAVGELDALGGPQQEDRVLAHHITAAGGAQADLGVAAHPQTVAHRGAGVGPGQASALGGGSGQAQGGAAGGVGFVAVVQLEDLGLECRAQGAGGLAHEGCEHGHPQAEVGGGHHGSALGVVLNVLKF
jgi:hypothetical protein